MQNKKVKNAKVHEYEGLIFKSGLELFCYKTLRELDIPFIYQPEKTVLLESFKINFKCYEDIGKIYRDDNKKIVKSTKRFDLVDSVREISYTPDFIDPTGLWIMETKGYAAPDFPLRWKMFKSILRNSRFEGLLLKPENQKEILECVKLIQDNGKEICSR
jgi:hypothetical protein